MTISPLDREDWPAVVASVKSMGAMWSGDGDAEYGMTADFCIALRPSVSSVVLMAPGDCLSRARGTGSDSGVTESARANGVPGNATSPPPGLRSHSSGALDLSAQPEQASAPGRNAEATAAISSSPVATVLLRVASERGGYLHITSGRVVVFDADLDYLTPETGGIWARTIFDIPPEWRRLKIVLDVKGGKTLKETIGLDLAAGVTTELVIHVGPKGKSMNVFQRRQRR